MNIGRLSQRPERILSSPFLYLFKASDIKINKCHISMLSSWEYRILRSSTHLWLMSLSGFYHYLWEIDEYTEEINPFPMIEKGIWTYEILTHWMLEVQWPMFDCTASHKSGIGTFLVKQRQIPFLNSEHLFKYVNPFCRVCFSENFKWGSLHMLS